MKTANNKTTANKVTNLKNISSEQLAEMDLDEINIYTLLELLENNETLKEKLTTKKGSKEGMYKKDAKKENESDKNFRSRIRKERNTFTENILKYFQNKDDASLKKEIVSFNKFYKETYLLNDYTVASVARLNSDKVTLSKLNLMFQVVKRTKIETPKKVSKKVSKTETK